MYLKLRTSIKNLFSFCIVSLLSVSVFSQTDSVRFAVFGDYGVDNSNEQAVADLVSGWNPDFIVTTGDNSYGSNSIDNNIGKYYSDYIGNYMGSFGTGSPINRFFPSIGNHDYSDGAGISAYLSYFSLPGDSISSTNTSGKEHYYDFVMGPVHFFAINSNIQESDGIDSNSVQAQWLHNQLTNSIATYKIVYMHHPPYSSSSVHGSETVMQWPYENWGATAVLTGHDHTYERIMRDDNNDTKMFPYFVTGLGGRTPYAFPSSGFVSGSEVRYNAAYGSMLVDATEDHIIFKFYSVAGGAGGTLVDSLKIDNLAVGINEDTQLPANFVLKQNYPNPFNPSTTIEYSLLKRTHVKLEIFNLLGQRVTVLVDRMEAAGVHTVIWDGKNAKGKTVTTGAYFYRMKAGEISETKKMLMSK